MYGTLKKTVEMYNRTFKSSVIERFQLKIDCVNAENDVLTHVPNPKITKIKNQNPRIRPLRFQEEGETQDLLPAHIMLGVSDYQQVRTNESQELGLKTNNDSVAEFRKLGRTLCEGIARKAQLDKQFFVNNEKFKFQKMCCLNVQKIEVGM